METTDSSPNTDYGRNFVIAKNSFEEDLGAIPSILIGNAYYGNYGVPQEALETETLAYMMPEPREINVSASFIILPTIERCDCVSFIKEYWSEFKGIKLYYPEYVWENFQKYGLEKTEPQIGALVIFKNHIAVVSKVLKNEIEIVEKNQTPCKVGRRIIDKNYEKIIGFLR